MAPYRDPMCTIVLAWHGLPAASGVRALLAANRDEARGRPSAPPRLLAREPDRWGGQDLLAGGTWLAVDPQRGRVAAVTNRHPGGVVPHRDPTRRSRGGLPLDLLAGDDDAALRLLSSVEPHDYNPVNLLYLGDERAWWAGVDDVRGSRVAEIRPGVHVLGEDDLDDDSPKIRAIRTASMHAVSSAADVGSALVALRDVLSSHERHGDGPQTAACIHEEMYGTVSSATVVVSDGAVSYDHADGPPCVTDFRPITFTP